MLFYMNLAVLALAAYPALSVPIQSYPRVNDDDRRPGPSQLTLNIPSNTPSNPGSSNPGSSNPSTSSTGLSRFNSSYTSSATSPGSPGEPHPPPPNSAALSQLSLSTTPLDPPPRAGPAHWKREGLSPLGKFVLRAVSEDVSKSPSQSAGDAASWGALGKRDVVPVGDNIVAYLVSRMLNELD